MVLVEDGHVRAEPGRHPRRGPPRDAGPEDDHVPRGSPIRVAAGPPLPPQIFSNPLAPTWMEKYARDLAHRRSSGNPPSEVTVSYAIAVTRRFSKLFGKQGNAAR